MNDQNNSNILYNEQFPLSNKYDPMWIIYNAMGPNPLWLTEWLTPFFDLKPGMRVLDLGCGKGITSVFLAREFGVQVYAVDFDEWAGLTSPEMRWDNAKEYGVEDLVIPVKADARKLPFAKGFFDAVICVDAYIYFGQDDSYLENILYFLRPGGKIGMVVPGFMNEVSNGVPNYLAEFLGDELWTWKSLPWWKNHWEKTNLVSINVADKPKNGFALWFRWEEIVLSSGKYDSDPKKFELYTKELENFRTDNGEYMGQIRLIATKK
ncbi:MAG: class I SAM-dependent methyltransferase [Defluviitaleaceae bacterium]|nr:class I SAM-dependent methyltransferase [Defluviitaleaceae bacterium]